MDGHCIILKVEEEWLSSRHIPTYVFIIFEDVQMRGSNVVVVKLSNLYSNRVCVMWRILIDDSSRLSRLLCMRILNTKGRMK